MAYPRLSVLFIDDCQLIGCKQESALADLADIVVTRSPGEGVRRLQSRPFDAVVMEMQEPGGRGLEIYQSLASHGEDTALIFLTDNPHLESALHEANLTAYDSVVLRPFQPRLRHRLQQLQRMRHLANQAAATKAEVARWLPEDLQFNGTSRQMMNLRERIAELSRLDQAALIVGETGTGKLLACRMIHQHSDRAGGPFVPVRCDQMTPSLAACVLFGSCESGNEASMLQRRGLMQIAAGGTLVLEEIASLGRGVQQQLQRAIERGQAHRIGDHEPYQINLRILATVSGNFDQSAHEQQLEGGLLKQIGQHVLRMPALRTLPTVQTLAEMEWRMIQTALREARGNKPAAAKALGISLRTLYNRLENHAAQPLNKR